MRRVRRGYLRATWRRQAELFMAIVLTAVVSIIWGVSTRFVHLNVGQGAVTLPGHIVLSDVGIGTIIAAVVVLGGAALVLRYTRFGAATRAAAENPLLATYRGVNVAQVAAITWGFAMATATKPGAAPVVTTHAGRIARRMRQTSRAAEIKRPGDDRLQSVMTKKRSLPACVTESLSVVA